MGGWRGLENACLALHYSGFRFKLHGETESGYFNNVVVIQSVSPPHASQRDLPRTAGFVCQICGDAWVRERKVPTSSVSVADRCLSRSVRDVECSFTPERNMLSVFMGMFYGVGTDSL